MSTTTQIYNQTFKFDVSFVNADIINDPQYLPLSYGAVEKIEIIDNITDSSLSGYAILDNFNDSLNSSPQFDFAKTYNNIFNFNVEQIIDSNNTMKFYNSFIVDNIYTLPRGEIVNKLCIEFYDVFFGTLGNKTINDVSQVARYKTGRVSDIMRNILDDFSQTTLIYDHWNDTTDEVDLQFDPSSSILDIYSLAYRHNFTSNTGAYQDAVMNIQRDNGDIFTRLDTKHGLEPINDRFLKLYSKLYGASKLNLEDSVIEGIMESGAQPEDMRTGMGKTFSEATQVQILRPDPKRVRDLYRNVIVESVDENGVAKIHHLKILETLANFNRLFCNNSNYSVDIPVDLRLTDPEIQGADAIKYSAVYPELEPGLTQAKLYNSILFNSKMITFKVKGQTYRQPGYFIYFQPRREASSTISGKDAHYNSLVGFWFIVEVRHVFTGNTYDNIITCVNPFVRIK
jgi:hypothetical protein